MCEVFSIIGSAIAGAVGASVSAGAATAIGVGATAVAGAGLGAGVAAARKGNILKGALFGGLGGVMGAGAFGGAIGAGASAFGATASTGAIAGAGAAGGIAGGIGGGLLSSNMDKAKKQAGLASQSAYNSQQEVIKQIKDSQKNNGISAIQQTATALKNKPIVKRTLGSLRIGLNSADTATGLNIPT